MTELSMYEQFNPLTTVAKSRFVELFQGDALDTDRWTETTFNTAPTFRRMSDTINGGYEVVTAPNNNTGSFLDFGDKRQYSKTGSVAIWVSNRDASGDIAGGFTNTEHDFSTWLNSAFIRDLSGEATLFVNTSDGTTDQQSSMISTGSTTPRVFKMELKSSSGEASINGTLEVTNSTNLPATEQQPIWGFRTNGAFSRTGRINYFEAYNT